MFRFSRIPTHAFVPALIFAAASIVVISISAFTFRVLEQLEERRLEQSAEDLTNAIERRFQHHVSFVRSFAALFSLHPEDIHRETFRDFTRRLTDESTLAGLQGIGVALRTEPRERRNRETFVRRAYGRTDLSVWPTLDGTQYPIMLLEPSDERNQAALGYDMYSEPVRRAAMDRALATGWPTLTGRVELKQEIGSDKQAGFLVYAPIQPVNPRQPGTVFLPQVNVGFAFAPFRAGDFLRAATGALGQSLAMTIYDSTRSEETVLYRSDLRALPGAKARQTSLELAGRTWLVDVAPTADFARGRAASLVLPMALLGLIASAVFALALYHAIVARNAALALAKSTRRDAGEKTMLLHEMRHRLGNTIAKIQSIARQSARDAPDLPAFFAKFQPRLEAMAARNELLTRVSWEGASLEVVVRNELAPYLDPAKIDAAIDGPEIMLSARLVLVLGLTIHELATNASKYGGLSENGRGLKISWQREGDLVNIAWDEDAHIETTETQGTGFGSKLIHATIERELGGSFAREMTPDGIKIRIKFSLAET